MLERFSKFRCEVSHGLRYLDNDIHLATFEYQGYILVLGEIPEIGIWDLDSGIGTFISQGPLRGPRPGLGVQLPTWAGPRAVYVKSHGALTCAFQTLEG